MLTNIIFKKIWIKKRKGILLIIFSVWDEIKKLWLNCGLLLLENNENFFCDAKYFSKIVDGWKPNFIFNLKKKKTFQS